MKTSSHLFSLALLLQFSAVAIASESRPTPPPGVIFEAGLVYGKAGETELRLNLARPEKIEGSAPAIVVIHGGGWVSGDRSAHDDLTWKFAQRGFVSATISYRLAPDPTFPAQVEDAKCAVRFLRAHAERFQIDAERIGAVGLSAGAHLSMMLGTTADIEELEGTGGWPDESSRIQAVVSFVGPTDLAADDLPELTGQFLTAFLGGPRDGKLERYRLASPITHVSNGDAPMLLFQGTRDPLIPNTQATRMAEALTQAGVPGRVELILGAGHGWAGDELTRTLEETIRFFETHLRGIQD